MKQFAKQFVLRGMMVAWCGPVVVAIVWLCIHGAGEMDTLTVQEAALGIISSVVMAFIAAGLPAVYQAEQLPLTSAILIHCAGLYLDYLLVYLINGWMPAQAGPIGVFTICFVTGFALIWIIIYIIQRKQAHRLSKHLNPQ